MRHDEATMRTGIRPTRCPDHWRRQPTPAATLTSQTRNPPKKRQPVSLSVSFSRAISGDEAQPSSSTARNLARTSVVRSRAGECDTGQRRRAEPERVRRVELEGETTVEERDLKSTSRSSRTRFRPAPRSSRKCKTKSASSAPRTPGSEPRWPLCGSSRRTCSTSCRA